MQQRQRRYVRAALLPACLLLLCAAGGAAAASSAPGSEQLRERRALERLAALGLPVRCGGPRTREVALTFDDGPGPYTWRLLKVLRTAPGGPVPATFFSVGSYARAYPLRERAEARQGAVGDHTWSHALLTAVSPARAWTQMRDGKQAIRRAARAPVRLFRAPYGSRNATVDGYARRLGLVEVLWSVDSRDWAVWSAAQVVANIRTGALKPGAIILMHETNPQTLAALPAVLSLLRARHLTPVTVPRLLADDPPSVAQLRSGACP